MAMNLPWLNIEQPPEKVHTNDKILKLAKNIFISMREGPRPLTLSRLQENQC